MRLESFGTLGKERKSGDSQKKKCNVKEEGKIQKKVR